MMVVVVVVKVKSGTCKQRAGKLEMSRAGDDQMPRCHQTDSLHLLHVTKQTSLCVHKEGALVKAVMDLGMTIKHQCRWEAMVSGWPLMKRTWTIMVT